MNPLLQWAAHPLVHRLGWTLLHFLWQGAVIAALFAIAQTAWPKRSGNARYLTGSLALLLMLAAPLITFAVLRTGRPVPVAFSAGGPLSNQTDPTDPTDPSAVARHSTLNHNLNLNPNPPSPRRGRTILHLTEKPAPGGRHSAGPQRVKIWRMTSSMGTSWMSISLTGSSSKRCLQAAMTWSRLILSWMRLEVCCRTSP